MSVYRGDGHVDVTAVAIDKDKNSQCAVKWAVDNLLTRNPNLILIHVRLHTQGSEATPPQRSSFEAKQLFLPYRGFCARKGVQVKEIILDDSDVIEALVSYIKSNFVTNIVVGASTRSILVKRFKSPDVPTCLIKCAPEFCSLYVISKGRAVTIRSASRPPPPQPKQHQHSSPSSQDAIKTPAITGNGSWPSDASTDRTPMTWDKTKERMRTPPRDTSIASSKSSSSSVSMENIGNSSTTMHTPRTNDSRDSIPEASTFSSSSSDTNITDLDASTRTSVNSSNSLSDSSPSAEAEMMRLKLELLQTMQKYSSVCKEAISAKQKAKEFHKWKMEEAKKFAQAKMVDEQTAAFSSREKPRSKVVRGIPEAEARKRREAEKKARMEEEEKKKVLSALAKSKVRYQKYTIEEIKDATNDFSDSLKIGEGGYGPVFRGYLDQTQVAIKILRPDAAQGMKQFQQEVEVLSCIRHPNMVLLLGACPEYGCLVYEYMDNGSLDDRLFRKDDTAPIPWWTRFKIAAEIGTGLLFLHQSKPEPLVHRDLKPANILLDHNYMSKISDVGLARLVPPSVADSVTQYHMTSAAGTFCYIDPEYQQTGMLGTKSDIYSLGIMLLQIITAKSPMGLAHQVERSIEKGIFASMLDPTVPDWPIEEALSYARMALRCAELRKKDRPDLSTEILPELNRLSNLR